MAKSLRDPAKEVFWREALQRFAASGLSIREFCQREQRICILRLAADAWRAGRWRLPPAFVSAVVTAEAGREASLALELPGGCVLKFSGPTEQLADLIVALRLRCAR